MKPDGGALFLVKPAVFLQNGLVVKKAALVQEGGAFRTEQMLELAAAAGDQLGGAKQAGAFFIL